METEMSEISELYSKVQTGFKLDPEQREFFKLLSLDTAIQFARDIGASQKDNKSAEEHSRMLLVYATQINFVDWLVDLSDANHENEAAANSTST